MHTAPMQQILVGGMCVLLRARTKEGKGVCGCGSGVGCTRLHGRPRHSPRARLCGVLLASLLSDIHKRHHSILCRLQKPE